MRNFKRYEFLGTTAQTEYTRGWPDQFWHVDTTVIKLLDQTKIYLHAVIDNFSRKTLAWRVCEKFEFTSTVAILTEAALNAVSAYKTPTVVVDAGVENLNVEG